MWLFVPVHGISSPLARAAGISALLAGYTRLWHVSSPAFEPYTTSRATTIIYLEEQTAWLEISNSMISLRKFQAFSLPLVSSAHKKIWEHSWQNVFSFHIQDRNIVNIYKNMTAVSLDRIILIKTEKASLPEYTLFMTVARATQLYNCVIVGQALHRFSNI